MKRIESATKRKGSSGKCDVSPIPDEKSPIGGRTEYSDDPDADFDANAALNTGDEND
jgi:hypothetical protein